MRSMAPGAKFSTSTSASRISFSMTSLPSGVLVLIASERFVAVQHREVQGVDVGDVAQLVAGHVTTVEALDLQDVGTEPGEHLHAGPAWTPVKSITLIPLSSRLVMMGSLLVADLWCLLLLDAGRVEVG